VYLTVSPSLEIKESLSNCLLRMLSHDENRVNFKRANVMQKVILLIMCAFRCATHRKKSYQSYRKYYYRIHERYSMPLFHLSKVEWSNTAHALCI